MNTFEADNLVRTISSAYPVWNPPERQALLRGKLMKHDYHRAEKGVDHLIENFNKIPSIADILQSIMLIKMEVKVANCLKCNNEGWIITDPTDRTSYKKCDCSNQNNQSTDSKNKETTAYGDKIATFDESCWALYKGIKNAPECAGLSNEELIKRLKLPFPERAKRLEELLLEEADIF